MNNSLKLPSDATLFTQAQREAVVNYLSTLPLENLRARQTILEKEIILATERQLDQVLKNLQVKQELLRVAVEKKEFPT